MLRATKTIISRTIILFALIVAGALGAAEQPFAATSSPNVGLDQLMRMADFLAKLDQFSFQQQSGYDVVQVSGQKIEFIESRKLVFDRPDKFRIDAEKSNGDSAVTTYDGKTMTILNLTRNLYASSEIKGDVDGAIIHIVQKLKMRFPLALLLVTTVPEELKKRVLQVDIVETRVVDGESCSHLAVQGDSVDFQVWLPTDGDPLPKRLILTYKLEEGQPQYWANFSDWKLSPDLPVSLFTLELPKDATRMQLLAESARTAIEGEK